MRFVLARPRHPGNIGAAARAVKVMGWDDLRVVAPEKEGVFPADEATARAASAVDVLERHPVAADLDEAVGDCSWVVGLSARSRTEGPEVLDIRDAAAMAFTKAGNVAWVFGNERFGLSNDELKRCHVLVHIPTGPALSSLNLGAAVQVVAYELWRARPDAQEPPPAAVDEEDQPATRAYIDIAVEHLWATVTTLEGVDHDGRIDAMRERLRRMIARSGPTVAEARVLHGMASWIERWQKRHQG